MRSFHLAEQNRSQKGRRSFDSARTSNPKKGREGCRASEPALLNSNIGKTAQAKGPVGQKHFSTETTRIFQDYHRDHDGHDDHHDENIDDMLERVNSKIEKLIAVGAGNSLEAGTQLKSNARQVSYSRRTSAPAFATVLNTGEATTKPGSPRGSPRGSHEPSRQPSKASSVVEHQPVGKIAQAKGAAMQKNSSAHESHDLHVPQEFSFFEMLSRVETPSPHSSMSDPEPDPEDSPHKTSEHNGIKRHCPLVEIGKVVAKNSELLRENENLKTELAALKTEKVRNTMKEVATPDDRDFDTELDGANKAKQTVAEVATQTDGDGTEKMQAKELIIRWSDILQQLQCHSPLSRNKPWGSNLHGSQIDIAGNFTTSTSSYGPEHQRQVQETHSDAWLLLGLPNPDTPTTPNSTSDMPKSRHINDAKQYEYERVDPKRQTLTQLRKNSCYGRLTRCPESIHLGTLEATKRNSASHSETPPAPPRAFTSAKDPKPFKTV